MQAIRGAGGCPNATYNDGITRRWATVAREEFTDLARLAIESEAFRPFVTRPGLGVLMDRFLHNLFDEFWQCACELFFPFRNGTISILEEGMPDAGFPTGQP